MEELFQRTMERLKNKPKAIELAKKLKQAKIDPYKLSENEVDDILLCFLIAGR